MGDGYIQHRGTKSEAHCEFDRTLKGEYCPENGEVKLDGSMLCNWHADHLRVEELVTYWRAILAHVELWSGEARSTGRMDLVCLLEIEEARASVELGRALEAMEMLEDGRQSEARSVDGEAPPLRPFLLSLL
jgi:hypothetical protein